MTELAREIRFVTQDSSVLIDGQRLEFYLKEKPYITVDCQTGIHEVHFVVLAESVVVEHPS